MENLVVEKNGLVMRVKPRSETGRVFVVGDIHGDYELFMEKLILVNFDRENDLVISVGDLCDRGRANLQCVKLLDEPWFLSVRGNHEEFCMMGFFDSHIARIHSAPNNGGAWFYKHTEEVREWIVRKFYALPLAMEIDYKGHRYGFTHADMPLTKWDELKLIDDPDELIGGRSISDLLIWSRDGYDTPDSESEGVEGVRALFHGHTPTKGKVEKRANEVYVDFGACFGYDLCVVELDEVCQSLGL